MRPRKRIGVVLAAVGAASCAAACGFGRWVNARDDREARRVEERLTRARESAPPSHDPARVENLPEIARRYFRAAIAPGTPLVRVVELEMVGSFLLGSRAFPMAAEQILAPPYGFVWRARMGSGLMRFAGSDGYQRGGYQTGVPGSSSWTRFWLGGVIPLARVAGGRDHARAAAARMAMEAIWTPAALLPEAGASWRQVGPDRAEVTFPESAFPEITRIEPVILTLDGAGLVVEIETLRWTDANPERRFQLQPFGGRMTNRATFQGFTIPTEMEIGNFWGTPDYAPFFRATLTSVRY